MLRGEYWSSRITQAVGIPGGLPYVTPTHRFPAFLLSQIKI
jgi:hypothetical protein